MSPSRLLQFTLRSSQACLAILYAPAILVASLLGYPVSCSCGADFVHDHSIFAIHGHHHGAGHHHHHEDGTSPARQNQYDGPTVGMPAAGSGTAFTAILTAITPVTITGGQPVPVEASPLRPPGTTMLVESPPPRTAIG